MSDAKIGRVLVASLHQAIVEELPTRLEFYEHWLTPEGLRGGTVGLAPWLAVLSFLRQEEAAYGRVVGRAGELAANWRIAEISRARRVFIERLPGSLRARAVLGVARRLVREGYRASRGRVSLRRGRGRMTVDYSLFCEVREPVAEPLCGFYASVAAELLRRFKVQASVSVIECRGAGGTECVVGVTLASAPACVDTPTSLG